ncbi:benzyl alcohol O-benzoyltransferase-like [Prosopis cineraria]|uniref:benzyl alcohol O-benzoyltransferase-like n=1 Tax=Prosopis cineraria TaxID=364024 RepID=UPI00240FA4A7|nr:benzyl alcohol O-benzoyltransferase-like [Prosopis cineraria]
MALHCLSDPVFTLRRRQPELISPAKPTPHGMKLLSDLDDQDGLPVQTPIVQLYRFQLSMAGKDPVKVIRDALAQTLLFYYPFAGRLREGEGRKLMVECNEEGVMFIEADADVALQQFGDDLQPPFPCFEGLLYSPLGSDGNLHCPLVLIQVTRLKCGGSILALCMNHSMSDGPGIVQFMKAMAEIANGAIEPSILPVWHGELLNVRDLPNITCTHHEYREMVGNNPLSIIDMVHHSFFFRPTEVSSLRRFNILPDHLSLSTSYDVVTTCLWCCHTKALQLDPLKEVRVMLITNARSGRNNRFNPPLPEGYYGNAFVYPTAISTIGKLCKSPLGFALEVGMKAKDEVNDEYFHSVADLMVVRGRRSFTTVRSSFMVSDLSRLGFKDVDFGWGKAVYGGVAMSGLGTFSGLGFYVGFRNSKGEEGRVIPMCLPLECMDRFAKELDLIHKGLE